MSFKKSSGQGDVGFVFQTNPAGLALAKPPTRQTFPRSATRHGAPGRANGTVPSLARLHRSHLGIVESIPAFLYSGALTFSLAFDSCVIWA
jgi:hypothetical protein